MLSWLTKRFSSLPRPLLIVLTTAWYGLLIALALFGAIEPNASFQYLAM